MEVKRIYNRELKFIFAVLLFMASVISVSFLILSKKTDVFENLLKNADYKALYSYIDNPDFTEETFEEYVKYNFGKDTKVLKKSRTKEKLNYTIMTVNGEKELKMIKVGRNTKWAFDDYIYGWKIKLPQGAKLFVEGQEIQSKDGMAEISRIPFAVYDVSAVKNNYTEYSERIMAGQSVDIKMDILPSVCEECEKIIRKYLAFREEAVNKKHIGDIECVSKDSGLYREMVDEVEWIKTIDYSIVKKLEGIEIGNTAAEEDDNVVIDVVEKWAVSTTLDGNTTQRQEIYKNQYTIKTSPTFMITQVKTN